MNKNLIIKRKCRPIAENSVMNNEVIDSPSSIVAPATNTTTTTRSTNAIIAKGNNKKKAMSGRKKQDKDSNHHKGQWSSMSKTQNTQELNRLLQSMLRNCAPLKVIQTLLQVIPEAAQVPDSGPSALQIALRNNASIDVIEEVIKACPYALFTGNGSYDPLAYAKIWRSNEKDLIELLERPISYWVKPSNHEKERMKTTTTTKTTATDASTKYDAEGGVAYLGREDRRELANLKLISSAMIKSHRKQRAETSRNHHNIISEIEALRQQHPERNTNGTNPVVDDSKQMITTMSQKFEAQTSALCKVLSESIEKFTLKQDQLVQEMKEMERRHKEEIKTLQEKMSATTSRNHQVRNTVDEEDRVKRLEEVVSSFEVLLAEFKTSLFESSNHLHVIEQCQELAPGHMSTLIIDGSPCFYPTVDDLERRNDSSDEDPLITESLEKRKRCGVDKRLFSVSFLGRCQTKKESQVSQ